MSKSSYHKINDSYGMVEVPEGAFTFKIIDGFLIYYTDGVSTNHRWSVKLPCEYAIAAEPGKVDEQLAELLVKKPENVLAPPEGWELNYFHYEKGDYSFDTATESFHSYCRSKGKDPLRVVIVKTDKI